MGMGYTVQSVHVSGFTMEKVLSQFLRYPKDIMAIENCVKLDCMSKFLLIKVKSRVKFTFW